MIPALLVRTLASGGNSSDSSNALAADERGLACPPRRAACTAVCRARQPSLGALAAGRPVPPLGMKTVGNGRENPLTVPATVFFVGNGNGNGKIGRENEIGITGYRERNQSVGSMPITIGNR